MGKAGKCIISKSLNDLQTPENRGAGICPHPCFRELWGIFSISTDNHYGGVMYILRPDEKTTPVMLYTKESVVRGELVTKEIVYRINIWLRTDGVPKYMHLLNAQVDLLEGGGAGRTL